MTPEARLVVVDDEPAIRELLTTTLRFSGFEVHPAPDGATALALVEAVSPDLVVLDVMLPDLDGFAVTAAMRARGPAHAPVGRGATIRGLRSCRCPAFPTRFAL